MEATVRLLGASRVNHGNKGLQDCLSHIIPVCKRGNDTTAVIIEPGDETS